MVDAGATRRGNRFDQLHRMRVAQVEALAAFGDHDGVMAVGREIHVVGIVHRNRCAGLAGPGVDRRHAAAGTAFGVIGDPQRLQIPGWHNVLRVGADLVGVDHLQRGRINHRHVARRMVGDVDARQLAVQGCAEMADGDVAVQIVRIGNGRHARHGDDCIARRLRHRSRGVAKGAAKQACGDDTHERETVFLQIHKTRLQRKYC